MDYLSNNLSFYFRVQVNLKIYVEFIKIYLQNQLNHFLITILPNLLSLY